jgi:hypothetical protein
MRCIVSVPLLLLAGCLCPPPVHDPGSFGQIPGVEEGAEAGQVIKALGNPNTRATGWWVGANRFDAEYVVWYYKEKGRVIFDGPRSLTVVTTEADASEDGRP